MKFHQTKSPDSDNITKTILDSLNWLYYSDNSQICKAIAKENIYILIFKKANRQQIKC